MHVRIVSCSQPSAWWESHIGRTITPLWIDTYGYWTRDTGPMGCLQWIDPDDTTPL